MELAFILFYYILLYFFLFLCNTGIDILHMNECTRKRKSTGGREVCVCG